MKSNRGQWAAILFLMFAMFLHTEGLLPNIFADEEEPIVLVKKDREIEFIVSFDKNSFIEGRAVQFRASYSNKGKEPILCLTEDGDSSLRFGADIAPVDDSLQFTDKLTLEMEGKYADSLTSKGMLLPGKTLNCYFHVLPYYKQDGSIKNIQPGKYILKLWYDSSAGEKSEGVFPITIVKRFGKTYIKNTL